MTASALELVELTKRYGQRAVVDRCSLIVEPGECVALLGPSGCGKTTTLRMIAGFIKPDAGRVVLAGHDVTAWPPNRRQVGLVFQNYSLFPHMTVAANVGYGLRARRVSRKERERRVSEALDLVELRGREHAHPRELSGGQQQRVALARALVTQPAVLLLDEPLSNLDARLRASLRLELREVQRRVQATTVLVTHDQEEALTIADRIVVMNDGRIEQMGVPEDVYVNPATPFVAGFMGDRNAFHCNVLELRGDEILLETTAGTTLLVTCNGSSPVTTSRMLAALRTDEISMYADSSEIGAGVPLVDGVVGVLERRTYIGWAISYRVRVGEDSLVVVEPHRSGGHRLEIGESVRLSWPRHAVRLIPLDG